jgi:glycerol-3-phosphate dehydrogenase
LPDSALSDTDAPDPVARAIGEEMAHTLADVVIRRTGVGAAGYPGDPTVCDIATRMQQLCGWSEQRADEELRSLHRFYELS